MRIFYPKWTIPFKPVAARLTIGTYCALCARPAGGDLDLCLACSQLLTTLQHTDRHGQTTTVCLSCGFEKSAYPAPYRLDGESKSEAENLTGQLAGNSPAAFLSTSYSWQHCDRCDPEQTGQLLRRIVAPYRYAFPMDSLIKRLKYTQDRQLARVLGTLLGRAVQNNIGSKPASAMPDVLLPMPLHPDRLRQRGFNQAHDIAQWAGKYLQIKVSASQVARLVDTGSLAGLNRSERQLRILGAFRAGASVHGKRVGIVDDVLTTGASSRELARELYDSGAASVELWVLARTSSSRSTV